MINLQRSYHLTFLSLPRSRLTHARTLCYKVSLQPARRVRPQNSGRLSPGHYVTILLQGFKTVRLFDFLDLCCKLMNKNQYELGPRKRVSSTLCRINFAFCVGFDCLKITK